jgi:hypothetical protein
MICQNCKQEKEELCKDDFCRECHATCSWEDCRTSTWEAWQLLNIYSREKILKIYPKAKI